MAEQIKYEDSELYKIRHSAAHVMAQAVMDLFPEAKYTIGPPVENGFYYDFDLPRTLTPQDLKKIQKKAKKKSILISRSREKQIIFFDIVQLG